MAGRLTPLTCRQIEKKLLKLGFSHGHNDKSIRFYEKQVDGVTVLVQVHFHPGEKGIEVIRSILRTGRIERDEWLRA